MTLPNRPRYATRLNAFKPMGGGVVEWIGAAASAGMDAADLNFPDHFEVPEADLSDALERGGMALNGVAMRYYSQPAMKLGAFTHPDAAVRAEAIDLTRRGMDACRRMGGTVITLWMGQDGVDYAFQGDYARMWDHTVEALRAVADHDPGLDVAVEYKPDEPRALALMPDLGHTLMALAEADRPNLGVTLDFAHVLYAGEMPAMSAALAARRSRILGVHLNDGYGRRDDGLMAGTVHPVATLELLVELQRQGYGGAIYFDTFPDAGGTDPVEEARTNLRVVERLRGIAGELAEDAALAKAVARQDAALGQRIVMARLIGA